MNPKKYLRLRGATWYFQKTLANGKLYSKSLKTDSLKEAMRHRDVLLKELSTLEPEAVKQYPQKRLRSLVHSLRNDYQEISKLDDVYFDDIHSVDEALKADDALLADAILIAGEGSSSSPNTGVKLDYTMSEVSEEYLSQVEQSKDITTLRAYRRSFENYSAFTSGKTIYLKSITRGTALKFIQYLSDIKKLSRKSIANQLGGLSGCYKFALDRDLIPPASNPFNGHKLTDLVKPIESEASEPFTSDEYKTVQTHINQSLRVTEARKWLAPIALLSGLRFTELMGVYKYDVKEINGVWCFDVKPTKDRSLKNVNAKRLVPIHYSILPVVLKLREDSSNEFLFPEVKGNKTIGGTAQTWFSRQKRALLPESKASFHGLRKNFTTALESSGVSEPIAASLLGHSKLGISYNLYSSGHEIEQLKNELNKVINCLNEFIKCFPSKHSK